jgi:hypothetical protein
MRKACYGFTRRKGRFAGFGTGFRRVLREQEIANAPVFLKFRSKMNPHV